jgi:hypothetical protein
MREFKLNRNAFKAQTAKEAACNNAYYQSISWQERLQIAEYLISVAYKLDPNSPPRLDRTKFTAKSMNE